MGLYIGRRLAIALLTMFGVAAIVFLAMHLIPGGYADIAAGPLATPQRKAQLNAELGLDKSVLVQFWKWISGVVQGNLGVSYQTNEPIVDTMRRRLPVTAELAIIATIFTVSLGLPLGLVAALKNESRIAKGTARFLSASALSVPEFVLGSLLLYLLSTNNLWFTVGNYVPFFDEPVANLQGMLIPALTISLFGISLLARTTRDAVLNVLGEPYITAATASGETRGTLIRRHVIRNASIPVIAVTANLVGVFISASVIVEEIFSLPGIGNFYLNAVSGRDYLVVEAGVLVAAAVFIGANMLADMAYVLIDPRIGSRQARQGAR